MLFFRNGARFLGKAFTIDELGKIFLISSAAMTTQNDRTYQTTASFFPTITSNTVTKLNESIIAKMPLVRKS